MRSAAWAESIASSAARYAKALRLDSSLEMRSSTAVVISTADTFLARMASTNSVAGVKQSSLSLMVVSPAQHVPPLGSRSATEFPVISGASTLASGVRQNHAVSGSWPFPVVCDICDSAVQGNSAGLTCQRYADIERPYFLKPSVWVDQSSPLSS